MEAWFEILIRQCILYSLPVLISLTLVTLIESKLTRTPVPHPFYALSWHGSWLPALAAIAMHRGVIIALPQPLHWRHAAWPRMLAHLLLTLIGFVLYSWSLNHQPPTGLPPLHHWWSKVFMFFNLCMAALHLLPLPLQLLGGLLNRHPNTRYIIQSIQQRQIVWLFTVLAASPLLDWSLGQWLIYPVYEAMSSLAFQWSS